MLGVIGAGQMGTGIALTAVMKLRTPTVLYDLSEVALNKQKSFARTLLQKEESKGRIQSAQDTFQLLRFTQKFEDLGEANVVIEAVREEFDVKVEVLREVERVCPKLDFLATNTSSISITKLAAGLKTPERFLGMHFMNPVPVMKLVEIIPGLQTNPQVKPTYLSYIVDCGNL